MRKKILFGLFMTTFIFFAITPVVNAASVELCLILDSSGSISSSDFNLQKEGLAQAIETASVVPQDGSVVISVIQFGSSATLEVPPTAITSSTVADSVAAAVRAISKGGGGTNMSAAIDLAASSGFTFAKSKQTIDLSTDGVPNSQSATITARDNAVSAGVDVLNCLGVGSGVNQSFMESLVWPQPASTPYDDGFFVSVGTFAEYVQAVKEKIKAEIQPAEPVPTLSEWGMIIMSLLLAGTAIHMIRRRQMSV